MDDWRCARCGDPIGVDDPLVILVGGEARHTSRFAEPDLPHIPDNHMHRACYETRWGDRSEGIEPTGSASD